MVAQYEERGVSSDNAKHHYGSVLSSEEGNINESGQPLLKDTELLQDELAGMTKLAIPVIITYLLEMFPGIITIILVGRVEYAEEDDNDAEKLSVAHLDAASLAVIFVNVVALSPAFGLLTAMDTLCSQAHGADQPQLMGTYSLTGFAVISIVFLSSTILIWNASAILIYLGQPIAVSHMAGEFIIYMLWGIPFLYVYELIRKVGQSRNEVMPMLISTILCNLVNGFLGYYLVHYTEWGWFGAAVARSVGNFITVPTIVICTIIGGDTGRSKDYHVAASFGDWDTQQYLEVEAAVNNDKDNEEDKEFLQHLVEGFVIKEGLSAKAIIEFLSLGFPGMLQTMFEWVAFEVIALLCGILPGKEAIVGIGANSVIMNVSSLTYMLYLGVSVSGNVRVGNALGAGDAHRAEIASNLSLLAGGIMSLINVVLLLRFRKELPYFFTLDQEIIEKAQHLFLIAAAFQLPDAINGALQGIFRGSGRQALAAKCNFIAYYIVGIPLGYILGIKYDFGVEGLWVGMTCGLLLIAIGMYMFVVHCKTTVKLTPLCLPNETNRMYYHCSKKRLD